MGGSVVVMAMTLAACSGAPPDAKDGTETEGTLASALVGGPVVCAVERDVIFDGTTTVDLADGTALPGGFVANNATQTTGRSLQKFTDPSTGFSFTRNENGPNWFTFDQTTTPGFKASGTSIGTGQNANIFGPKSQAALAKKGIDVPTLTFTSGLLILHVVFPLDGSTPFVDDLSLRGNLVDGCALLAAGG
jgi:hypothetical protein